MGWTVPRSVYKEDGGFRFGIHASRDSSGSELAKLNYDVESLFTKVEKPANSYDRRPVWGPRAPLGDRSRGTQLAPKVPLFGIGLSATTSVTQWWSLRWKCVSWGTDIQMYTPPSFPLDRSKLDNCGLASTSAEILSCHHAIRRWHDSNCGAHQCNLISISDDCRRPDRYWKRLQLAPSWDWK